MTLSDFLHLLLGSVVTGLVCATIYAAIVVWIERSTFRRIWSALRGRGA